MIFFDYSSFPRSGLFVAYIPKIREVRMVVFLIEKSHDTRQVKGIWKLVFNLLISIYTKIFQHFSESRYIDNCFICVLTVHPKETVPKLG